MSDIHGRDHVTHAELAVTKDGKFLGFKNETIANLGAYARVFGTVTPTYLFGPCATGVYDIPAAYTNVKAVFFLIQKLIKNYLSLIVMLQMNIK